MPEYITDDIETSSDSDREDSDEEIPNEKKKNSDEENQVQNVFIFCIWRIPDNFGLFIKH